MGIDLSKLAVIPRFKEQNTLIDIVFPQGTHTCCVGGRQKVRPDEFRADCICFRRLQVLALIVTADGQRKAEPDDKSEQSQGSRHDNTEIFALTCFQISTSFTDGGADSRREPEHYER